MNPFRYSLNRKKFTYETFTYEATAQCPRILTDSLWSIPC